MEQPGGPEGAARVPHPFHSIRVGQVIACYLLLLIATVIGFDQFGLAMSSDPLKDPLGAVWLGLADMAITGAFVLYLLRRLRRHGLAWDRILGDPVAPAQFPRLLAFAAVQLGLALSLVTLIQILWPQSAEIFKRHPIYVPIGDGVLDLERYYLLLFNLVSCLQVVVFAPICEELIFRGWMLQRLWLKWGSLPKAIWCSSLIFGLLHQEHFFGATCFALLTSALYLHTANLRLNMLLHGFYNLCVLMMAIWLPKDFFLFTLPDWLDPIAFGGILLVTGLIYRRQLLALWPGADATAPLIAPEEFRQPEKPRRVGFRPADPAAVPLARLSLARAFGFYLLCVICGVTLASLLGQMLGNWVYASTEELENSYRAIGLGMLLRGFLSPLMIFGIWLLCLRLRYAPLPVTLRALLRRPRLPAGSPGVLLALAWLGFAWRWLGSGPLQKLPAFLQLSDLSSLLSHYGGAALALILVLILANILISAWFEQSFRQLIGYRCRSLAQISLFALLLTLLIHAASPVTAVLMALWLMYLSLESEDSGSMLWLQIGYNALFWVIQLIPQALLESVYELQNFELMMMACSPPALSYLIYRLIKARIALGSASETDEAGPATEPLLTA